MIKVNGHTAGIKVLGSGQSPIVFKQYAFFDKTKDCVIVLNDIVNASGKCIELQFYDADSSLGTDNATICTGYNHNGFLIKHTNNNNYLIAGNRSGDVQRAFSTGSHIVKWYTDAGKTEFDNEVVADAGTNFGHKITIGGRTETSTKWTGYFKLLKITDNTTGDVEHELLPCLFDNHTACLFDTVSKKFYYSSELTVMDTIPTN